MIIQIKNLLFLFVTISLLKNIESKEKHEHCNKLRDRYSAAAALFIQCCIKHAEPITFCHNCADKFTSLKINYTSLWEGIDTVHQVSCKELYFNLDRLNIIETLYKQSTFLWNSGSCTDCYDWHDNTFNQTISHETLDFYELLNQTETCIKNNTLTTVCEKCEKQYNVLNTYYDAMAKRKGDNICFDVKDVMNKTRLQWSSELKCVENRNFSPNINFIIVAACLVGLGVVMYSGCYIYVKRRRSYELLNNDTAEHQSVPTTGFLSQDQAPVSTVPSNYGGKRYTENDTDDEDDDDDDDVPPLGVINKMQANSNNA